MLAHKHFPYKRSGLSQRVRSVAPSRFRPAHRAFQRRIAVTLVAGLFISSFMFYSLIYLRVHQNYEFFQSLAYANSPSLLDHLDREASELFLLMLASLIAILSFCLILGFRLAGQLVRPLIHLSGHMKKVSKGDFSAPDFVFNEKEDWSEVLSAYSSFYRAERARLAQDIENLEKIKVEKSHHHSYAVWQEMLKNKKQALGALEVLETSVSPSDSVSETLPFPAVRRVS